MKIYRLLKNYTFVILVGLTMPHGSAGMESEILDAKTGSSTQPQITSAPADVPSFDVPRIDGNSLEIWNNSSSLNPFMTILDKPATHGKFIGKKVRVLVVSDKPVLDTYLQVGEDTSVHADESPLLPTHGAPYAKMFLAEIPLKKFRKDSA